MLVIWYSSTRRVNKNFNIFNTINGDLFYLHRKFIGSSMIDNCLHAEDFFYTKLNFPHYLLPIFMLFLYISTSVVCVHCTLFFFIFIMLMLLVDSVFCGYFFSFPFLPSDVNIARHEKHLIIKPEEMMENVEQKWCFSSYTKMKIKNCLVMLKD